MQGAEVGLLLQGVEVGLSLHSYFVSPNDTFVMTQQPPRGPRPAHYRGFTITLRHTTVCRTPLDQSLPRRKDLYLTTHNTHN